MRYRFYRRMLKGEVYPIDKFPLKCRECRATEDRAPLYGMDNFYEEHVACYYCLRKILFHSGRPAPTMDDVWQANYRAQNYKLADEHVQLHRAQRPNKLRPRIHENTTLQGAPADSVAP